MIRKLLLPICALAFVAGITACDNNDTPAERAGENISEAADEVGDGTEEVADDVGDGVEDAADDVKSATTRD